VHLGKLPEYRGRATVNWAIINDHSQTAVSIHKVVPLLDSGNLLAQKMIEIKSTDSINDVYVKINKYIEDKISSLVTKALSGYEGVAQKGKSTYCCTRLAEDGLIDWNKTSKEIHNLIRALTFPYPGAFSYVDEKKVIILESEIPKKPKKYIGRIPGRVISIVKGFGVEVLTGDSSLIVKKIFVDGQKKNASEYIKSSKVTFGINLSLLYEKALKIKV
jgi:methionyl-tRNA formyltransferase